MRYAFTEVTRMRHSPAQALPETLFCVIAVGPWAPTDVMRLLVLTRSCDHLEWRPAEKTHALSLSKFQSSNSSARSRVARPPRAASPPSSSSSYFFGCFFLSSLPCNGFFCRVSDRRWMLALMHFIITVPTRMVRVWCPSKLDSQCSPNESRSTRPQY